MDREKLTNLLVEYVRETSQEVQRQAKEGYGTKVLGKVAHRPDDVEIEIDKVGEQILAKLLQKYEIQALVFSETKAGNITNGSNPEVYGALDPFDNTVLYLKGFWHTWYTVLSFFSKDGAFLGGIVGDILGEWAWVNDGASSFGYNFKDNTRHSFVKSSRKDFQGSMVLASYIMTSQYSLKFLHTFWNLIKTMHPQALLYPFGGSHIYGLLAQGIVDAYVMFDEPRSEIDAGFGIAKAAGCEVGEVLPDGTWRDYAFIPGKQHEKVKVFIVACTKELRDHIIRYYLNTTQKHA